MRCLPQILLMVLPFLGSQLAQAEAVPAPETKRSHLYRGSYRISTLAGEFAHPTTGVVTKLTPENCGDIRDLLIEKDGLTRVLGSNVYRCEHHESVPVTFRANQSCPPIPADQTRPGTCPTGTEGSWTQTGSTTYSAAPTCTPTLTWRPVAPPEGACTPIPPDQLAAPNGVTATADSTSVITVRWNVVADALSYQVKRCIVPSTATTCTELRPLICARALSQTHVTLPPGTTVRYQVAASRDINCGTPLGADSAIVQATTHSTAPDPEGPPSACAGRQCTINWTPATSQPEGATIGGYRLVYGNTVDAQGNPQLVHSVQYAGATTRAGQLTLPAGGVWHFAIIAYTTNGTDSLPSATLSRTVQ